MVGKDVIKEIDRVIKETWTSNVYQDYNKNYIMNEDSLKCCLYYHLRRKLASILADNHLRIYTEFHFPELNYRADMVIAEVDPHKDGYIREGIENNQVAAIIELKFTSGADERTAEWIKHDLTKFKEYKQKANIDCQYYFAVIYETECSRLNWMDKRRSNAWAAGCVTELNAGFVDEQIRFKVHPYNGLNMGVGDTDETTYF